jgi:hypothetical protein
VLLYGSVKRWSVQTKFGAFLPPPTLFFDAVDCFEFRGIFNARQSTMLLSLTTNWRRVMSDQLLFILPGALLGMFLLNMPAMGADKAVRQDVKDKDGIRFENAMIQLRLRPRTAQQMAAFFEARGFPKPMRQALAKYCFMTVVMKNRSSQVVWLDLDNWRFQSAHRVIARIPRSQWPPLWQKMHIPMAAQSTFRWTLLPEQLDFQPQEGEGGNIILNSTNRPFALLARFAVGKDKQSSFNIHLSNLRCAGDAATGGRP